MEPIPQWLRINKWNRRLEYLLKDAEVLTALSFINSCELEDPKEKFNEIWKLVMLDQFHDVIPGTSIGLVYDDTREHYKHCMSTLTTIINEFTLSTLKALVCPTIEGTLERYIHDPFKSKSQNHDSIMSSNCFVAFNSENER